MFRDFSPVTRTIFDEKVPKKGRKKHEKRIPESGAERRSLTVVLCFSFFDTASFACYPPVSATSADLHIVTKQLIFINNVTSIVMRKKLVRYKKRKSSRKGRFTRKRNRKHIYQLYSELGPSLFLRTFRMKLETFHSLYRVMKDALWRVTCYNPNRRYAPNTSIHPTIRLAAGGDRGGDSPGALQAQSQGRRAR